MKDQIINGMLQPVNACAQFSYLGYEVSMSTIFRSNEVEVAVFYDNKHMKNCDTVAEAIRYINNKQVAAA